MKTCTKCGIEKIDSEFTKDSSRKNGFHPWCKACKAENSRRYRSENEEKVAARKKKYYEENKEQINQKNKINYMKNREARYRAARKWTKENQEFVRAYSREWKENNKERVSINNRRWNAKNKEYFRRKCKNRYRTDPIFRVIVRLRRSTYHAFQLLNDSKIERTISLLGCTVPELFTRWEVSELPKGYHIDHICPLAQAQTIEEVKKLCHYENLQLLPAYDNLRKSASKTKEGERLCRKLLGRDWVP